MGPGLDDLHLDAPAQSAGRLACAQLRAVFREAEQHPVLCDLEHLGDKSDQPLIGFDDDILKFIGIDFSHREGRFDPAAFQVFIKTRFGFYGEGKDAIVAPVAEINLEGIILKIDVVDLVDQMLLTDRTFAGGLLFLRTNAN